MRFVAILVSLVLVGCTVSSAKLTGSNVSSVESSNALAFQADTEFGKMLTASERANLSKAEFQALNYGKAGQQIGWKSDSGDEIGTIVAYQLFQVGSSNCRRFEHQISTLSGPEQTAGTACLNSDGAWRLIK